MYVFLHARSKYKTDSGRGTLVMHMTAAFFFFWLVFFFLGQVAQLPKQHHKHLPSFAVYTMPMPSLWTADDT
jgi:hypothetical protein